MTFKSPLHVEQFLHYMNNRHKNIRFTSEEEKDNKLSFLDVLIVKENGSIKTNIYRKPTFSGVYSNFKSFIPTKYKANLIATLLYRVYHITSKTEDFFKEVENVEKILVSNGYPMNFICICVKRFLKNRDKKKKDVSKENTVSENKKLVIMPYLGKMSSKIERTVKSLFRKALPKVKLQFVYKTSFKMCNLFRFKDQIPEDLLSDLVYLFKCGTCKDTYVGHIRRHFKVRKSEHSGVSPRTGKQSKGQSTTSVRDHMLYCPHRVTCDDFKIISKGGSLNVLETKETLFINKLKPKINGQQRSTEIFLFA